MSYGALVDAQKRLLQFSGWNRSEPDTGALWFDAPLEINGVVAAGLTLHGECQRLYPDQHVGLEIAYRIPGSRRRVPLARLDWRCLKGGHSNKRRSGWPLSGKRCSETHYHPFDLNWDALANRMRRGNLPVADEIDIDLQTFESMRAKAGMLLRINNIELVERPPWEYDLFRNG